jgi:hypothetical protein
VTTRVFVILQCGGKCGDAERLIMLGELFQHPIDQQNGLDSGLRRYAGVDHHRALCSTSQHKDSTN